MWGAKEPHPPGGPFMGAKWLRQGKEVL